MTSEVIGTFFFCFLFMLCTDKATQFSKDRVINCFIIAAAFCSSRLLSGGTLVSGIQTNTYIIPKNSTEDDFEWPVDFCSTKTNIAAYNFKTTGPLLNPALYIGQALRSFDFSSILSYCLCPFIGGVLSLVFYEFVFVKSQEYLDVDNESAENSDDSKEDIGNDI
jgi:glycerol uptake facilitator-like aquaporin